MLFLESLNNKCNLGVSLLGKTLKQCISQRLRFVKDLVYGFLTENAFLIILFRHAVCEMA